MNEYERLRQGVAIPKNADMHTIDKAFGDYQQLLDVYHARQQRADDTLWCLTAIAGCVAFSLLAYLVADLLAGGKTLVAWLHFVERLAL